METIKLIFTVSEQNISKTSGPSETASDTVSYVVARFDLGENWDGFDSVRAVFKNGPIKKSAVLDGNGECVVPWEVLENKGTLYVNLVGSIAEGEVLTDRLTTYSIFALENEKTFVDADLEEPIPSSQFEQFVEIVKEDADRAESARDDALQAKDDAGDYALYAKDYSESAESYRDEAKGYAEDAEEASQSILELTAEASVDSSVGTPSVAVTVSESSGHKVMDFAFSNLKGDQGERGADGADGEDGFSPIVTTTPIEGGTEVDIEDAQGHHTFNVLNGDVSNFYPFLPTDSASGSIASFPDGADNVPMSSLVADIEPIQDLHGQSSPYPAGGGKNVIDASTLNLPRTITSQTTIVQYSATEQTKWSVSAKVTNNASIGGRVNIKLTSNGSPVATVYEAIPVGATNAIISATCDGTGLTFDRVQLVISGDATGYSITVSDVQINKGDALNYIAPYSNICPISGRTEVRTVREGKNLFDEQSASTTWVNWNGVITTVSSAKTVRRSASAGETYTLSNANASSNTNALMISFFDKTDTIVSSRQIVTSGAKFITATAPTNTAYMIAGYFTWSETSEQQLEVGSSATTYEPYLTPLTITTELGQTVYGGTLDVVSGVLTVTHKMDDLGSYDWGYNSSYQFFAAANTTYKPPTSADTIPDIKCEVYQSASPRMVIDTTQNDKVTLSIDGYGGSNRVIIRDTAYSDAPTFKTAMSGVQLLYPLATPITIQLTPTEVRTLLGTNNFWSDSGDTSATYKADIQRYIDKQISAVLNA